MANRVLLGQISGTTYGLRISKKGQNVLTATGKNLLFDSTNQSPIFFSKTINIGNNAIVHDIGSRSSFDATLGYITHGGTKLQYNPLVIVIEDATGQNLNHSVASFTGSSTGTYQSHSSYISRLGVASNSLYDESIQETGAVYRTSVFYALNGTDGDTVNSTNNSYSMEAATTVNVKGNVRSYCFTANSGDHTSGNTAVFNPNNSENQRYNTFGVSNDIYKSDVTDLQSTDFGRGLRLEFRKQTGEANNDKFFRRDNGTFYTVTKANLGGLPITNAKAAVSTIPCGYGFMNSTFMGF